MQHSLCPIWEIFLFATEALVISFKNPDISTILATTLCHCIAFKAQGMGLNSERPLMFISIIFMACVPKLTLYEYGCLEIRCTKGDRKYISTWF